MPTVNITGNNIPTSISSISRSISSTVYLAGNAIELSTSDFGYSTQEFQSVLGNLVTTEVGSVSLEIGTNVSISGVSVSASTGTLLPNYYVTNSSNVFISSKPQYIFYTTEFERPAFTDIASNRVVIEFNGNKVYVFNSTRPYLFTGTH